VHYREGNGQSEKMNETTNLYSATPGLNCQLGIKLKIPITLKAVHNQLTFCPCRFFTFCKLWIVKFIIFMGQLDVDKILPFRPE